MTVKKFNRKTRKTKQKSRASRNSLKKQHNKNKKIIKLHGGSELEDDKIRAAINILIDPITDFKHNFNKVCRDEPSISILFQNSNYCDLAAINFLNRAAMFKSLYKFIKEGNGMKSGPDINASEIEKLSNAISEYSCTNKPTDEKHIEILSTVVDELNADNTKVIEIIQQTISNIPEDYFSQVVIDDSVKEKIKRITISVSKKIIRMYLGLEDSDNCDLVNKLNNLFELLNFFINENNRHPDNAKNQQILSVIINILVELLTPFINTEFVQLAGNNSLKGGGGLDKETAINAAIVIVFGIVILAVLAACIYAEVKINPGIFWYRRRSALININT
jgi:hypothetical protein